MTNTTIIVLGMHRSGTSCLAGILESAGLHLGEVNTKAPFNKKGNRENNDIMKLNDQVLANTGHTWRDPPEGPAKWTEADGRQRDAIISKLSEKPIWGFKDPRTLITLDGWLEALPSVKFVGTFRHPKRVAKSLASRPAPLHVPIEDGLALWQSYNRRLLTISDRFDMPIVNFDLAPDQYTNQVTKICHQLGLSSNKDSDFFDRSLRVSSDDYDFPISSEVMATYDALIKKSA